MIKQDKILILDSYFDKNEKKITFYGKGEKTGNTKINFSPVKIFCLLNANTSEEKIPTNFTEKKENIAYCLKTDNPLTAYFFNSYKDLILFTKQARKNELLVYEENIYPDERFLMENSIFSSMGISGKPTIEQETTTFQNPKVNISQANTNLKVFSVDIETNHDASQIFSIAIHTTYTQSENSKAICFIQSDKDENANENIVFCSSEKKLLLSFLDYLKKEDPDIIIGWFVIGFDLRVLAERCQAYYISFKIGRDDKVANVEKKAGQFHIDMVGRIVIDGLDFLRGNENYHFKNYKLETIAQQILGEGKLITEENKDKVIEIENLFYNDKKKLAEYNIKDCTIVSRLFKKLNIIEQIILESQITGVSYDKSNISSILLDFLFLNVLHSRKLSLPEPQISQNVEKKTFNVETISKEGVHKNILLIEIPQLIFNIINSFNINILSFYDKEAKQSIEGVEFSTNESFISKFFQNLYELSICDNSIIRNTSSQIIKKIAKAYNNNNSRYYNQDIIICLEEICKKIVRLTEEFFNNIQMPLIFMDEKQLIIKEYDSNKFKIDNWLDFLKEKLNNPKLSIKTNNKINAPIAFLYPSNNKKQKIELFYLDKSQKLHTENIPSLRSEYLNSFQKDFFKKALQENAENLDNLVHSFLKELENGNLNNQLKLVNRKNKETYFSIEGEISWERRDEVSFDYKVYKRHIATMIDPVLSHLNLAQKSLSSYEEGILPFE